MSDECSRKILCVGLCVLDIVHVCSEYPREDSDGNCLKGHWQRGGNASNNCTVLRQLGAKCEFLGVLSSSKSFKFLIDDCIQRGIEIINCPKVDDDPSFSSVLLNLETGTRTIIHSNPSFPILKYQDFKKIDLNEYLWIHFEGRNPEHTLKMMKEIQKYNSNNPSRRITISLELEKNRKEILTLINIPDYIFLSKDLAVHLGWNDMKSAAYGLRNMMTNKTCCIICPWGSVGASILYAEDTYCEINAHFQEKVIDSLGAGDTFCAAVIFAFCYLNKSPPEAIKFGNEVAGYKLTFYGYDQIGNKNFNSL